MSGAAPIRPPGLPDDAAGRQWLAGEYVLGTLDARAAARIVVALQADPELRQAVEAWEARLAPLALLARPEAPPPNVWERIETRITPANPARLKRARRWTWLWRAWALGATLATAGIATYAFLPPIGPGRMITVLGSDRNLPGILAEVDRKGVLRLHTMPAVTGRNLQAPSGRALQVWALPSGAPGLTGVAGSPAAAAPTSLTVLPAEPGHVVTVATPRATPVAGMVIQISVEPEGGSPTGRPTGPIVFIGRLIQAVPDR